MVAAEKEAERLEEKAEAIPASWEAVTGTNQYSPFVPHQLKFVRSCSDVLVDAQLSSDF